MSPSSTVTAPHAMSVSDTWPSALAASTPVETLRRRARMHVMHGAVTPSYAFDTQEVIQLLNASLATEWVCALRYKRHYYVAKGIKARSHAEYHAGKDLREMITEDLVAEPIAIESYRELVQHLADHDPTTPRMLEDIPADEEEHAEVLTDLLDLGPSDSPRP